MVHKHLFFKYFLIIILHFAGFFSKKKLWPLLFKYFLTVILEIFSDRYFSNLFWPLIFKICLSWLFSNIFWPLFFKQNLTVIFQMTFDRYFPISWALSSVHVLCKENSVSTPKQFKIHSIHQLSINFHTFSIFPHTRSHCLTVIIFIIAVIVLGRFLQLMWGYKWFQWKDF